jgi:hypothetical protein
MRRSKLDACASAETNHCGPRFCLDSYCLLHSNFLKALVQRRRSSISASKLPPLLSPLRPAYYHSLHRCWRALSRALLESPIRPGLAHSLAFWSGWQESTQCCYSTRNFSNRAPASMQSVQRHFGKYMKRSADEQQISVLLKDFEDADQLLARVRSLLARDMTLQAN